MCPETIFPCPAKLTNNSSDWPDSLKISASLGNPSGMGIGIDQCGDSIEVFLHVEKDAIVDLKVVPRGCVYTFMCAGALSELAKGRNLYQALELEPQDVVSALGGLPEDHLHCARLAVNTLVEAIADYYMKTLDCWLERSVG
jgi:nitrogen fixation NifU-like protein